MEIHPVSIIGKVTRKFQHSNSSNGKERCSIKNFMLLMIILHLIYLLEILVSESKCYRLVSWLQEKKGKRSAKWKKYLLPQNHIRKWKKLCIPMIQKVWGSHPLTKQKILDVYADVFKGLGTFLGEPYKFKLKENHFPALDVPRKVLIYLQDDFCQDINDLVKQGALEKVEHSTKWVNSFVIVEKDGSIDSGNSHAPHHQIKKKLQICLDPRDLNEALECESYYSRSVNELIAKFHGCIVFSIVDMKKGYWMVLLHLDSRPLTCISIDIEDFNGHDFQWKQLLPLMSFKRN